MSKAKSRIRRDDTVVVVAGKHNGVRGRVLRVWPSEDRVLVEGVNVIKRHQKPVGDQPGGIIEREAKIHVSNVALWVGGDDGRKVKVGFRVQRIANISALWKVLTVQSGASLSWKLRRVETR